MPQSTSRPRCSRLARAPWRVARLRRGIGGDDQRDHQSAAHPAQRARDPQAHFGGVHQRSGRAKRGRRLKCARRYQQTAGVPDDIVSRLAAGTFSQLARARRPVIAPSSYVSRAMIERYKLPADRITVIPRAVNTTKFNPAAVTASASRHSAAYGRAAAHARGAARGTHGAVERADERGRPARPVIGGGPLCAIVFVFAGEDRARPGALCARRAQARLDARHR